MDEAFCVNCGSAGGSMVLEDERILHCIRTLTAPQAVEAYDLVCTICWAMAQEMLATSAPSNIGRNCALCNKTLPSRSRLHQVIALRNDTQHHINIRNIIIERLMPLEVRASHYICHPCWQKADRAAKHYSVPSSSQTAQTISSQFRCVNCGINLNRIRRHILNDDAILLQVRQHVAPQVVTANDYICDSCHTLFVQSSGPRIIDNQDVQDIISHQNVCLTCGVSLVRAQRSHSLATEGCRHILHVVNNWIQPRVVVPSDAICHRCYQRADMAAARESLPVPDVNLVEQQPERITLPNYLRASDTHRRCLFPQCLNTFLRTVPFVLRVRLFRDHKYYIPPDCRICDLHLARHIWIDLITAENTNHSFTASHIEDFCELLKKDSNIFDLENIEQMEDNLVWYWLGRSKEQFRELLAELPDFHKQATSLGAYLIKLRTGDSDERIATLLNISRSSLTKLVAKARDVMVEHFVPAHLGLQHITREEVALRNLYIPESLFGNPGSDKELRKAIVIMDGTYVYVQKSSNYTYQKKTYSLHKYRNLVKPFIVTCCDGYIIDVLGPYPATKSDADILKEEFHNPSKPMRQYFRNGDVMILDRGFRDSIPLLENLNYSVHYPLSLEPREYQLSTVNANESRKVTLCRWVVEVVNGRFKRDFKLLRQEYFNRASKHLMDDFKVAAALINKFHPALVDRENAREIISIIQEKIFMHNSLADFVEQNNLNRRRAQFQSITVENDNLEEFPQMDYNDLILISLGVYQIKQARSYYGEHIRQNGSYLIEVCREVDQDLINELELISTDNVQLIRGKIHSRHIGNKTYFVYILLDPREIGRQTILQYCCNCIVGRRTIGCCAHIMSIIWFLSYARHQINVNPPAQFLDSILITDVDENED